MKMRPWIIGLTMLVGSGMFVEGSYMKIKAGLAQVLIDTSWAQRSKTKPPMVPWPWADTHVVAKIDFSDRSQSQMVMRDASGESLAFGPGMVVTDGNTSGPIVIAGHRDTHFSVLQHLSPGEIVHLELWNGLRESFKVTGSRIIDSRTEILTVEQEQLSLTLITCWPFDALVPRGPERYIVTAVPIT